MTKSFKGYDMVIIYAIIFFGAIFSVLLKK
nr:MAG TPA: hypothetical protein [Caudoviricetes sp.]